MEIAIIAEYNPFHYGHQYQLHTIKKVFPEAIITVFLAQDYSQRGEFIIQSYQDRQACALKNGADFVLPLANRLVLQGAPHFAEKILQFIKDNSQIKTLVFGSELNDLKKLHEFLKILEIEKKKELSGPAKANSNSLNFFHWTKGQISANDLLAIHYLQANQKLGNYFRLVSLKRITNKKENNYFVRASLVRQALLKKQNYGLLPCKLKALKRKIDYLHFQSLVINYQPQLINQHQNFEKGMAELFKKHIFAKDLEAFLSKVITKKYPRAKILRAINSLVEGFICAR